MNEELLIIGKAFRKGLIVVEVFPDLVKGGHICIAAVRI